MRPTLGRDYARRSAECWRWRDMSWTDLFLRVKALLFHHRAEQELDDELRAHIDIDIERRVRGGMSREQAERTALIAFGGAARVAEECRDERGIGWLEDFSQDLRFACRQFLKQQSFFAVAALTLALGIGANTAMFSAINAVLLRPVPYRGPDRLASVWCTYLSKGVNQMGFALPDLRTLAERNHSFESLSGYFFSSVNL